MIFQVHHQNSRDLSDAKTEFVAQSREFTASDDPDSLQKWVSDVISRHDLPEGRQWMVCDDTAPCFMWAKPGGEVRILQDK